MKKTIIGATALVVTVAVLRRFGPSLEHRVMAKCHEMMSARTEGDASADQNCACDPASASVSA